MAVQTLLRPVGYWTSRDGDALPDPRALMSPTWEKSRRTAIVAYLASSPILDEADDVHVCLICGAEAGKRDRTDGVWRWPEGLAHYVSAHGVKLPKELITRMASNRFRPPKVDVKALRDHLAPSAAGRTELMSKATAAAALDDMLQPTTKPGQKPVKLKGRSGELDDETAAIPATTTWTATVRGVPTKPAKIVFDRPIVLGRDRTCDVNLQHSSVSRRHVRLVPLNDRVIVQDLESANGVWVKGVKHQGQIELDDGDEMQVGQATITLIR